jgi:hypothetical protein
VVQVSYNRREYRYDYAQCHTRLYPASQCGTNLNEEEAKNKRTQG